MFSIPPIIANAAGAKQPEKKVLAGVINSALFTPSQHEAIDGIVRSSLPGDGKRHSELFKVHAGATHYDIGKEHIPGTMYPKGGKNRA
jgi:hypothetical protein